jgi:hypothetical protein
MDPFEEFEIKPLTEGLGFHKKSVPLAEQVKKSGLVEAKTAQIPSFAAPGLEPAAAPGAKSAQQNPQVFADLLKALESPVGKDRGQKSERIEARPLVTEPLPAPGTSRKRAMEVEIQRPEAPTFPNLNPRPATPSPLNKVVENVGLKRGAADSPVKMLERAPVAFSSAFLDGIVVFALSLVFLVALMTITQVDLASLVFRAGLDVPTKAAFVALFVSVMMMYVVVARSFFGRTLGEWTFDFQMGDDQQHKSAAYPLRVLLRSFFIVLTGVILFPVLSFVLNRDLLAPLTGLQLYRQR